MPHWTDWAYVFYIMTWTCLLNET